LASTSKIPPQAAEPDVQVGDGGCQGVDAFSFHEELVFAGSADYRYRPMRRSAAIGGRRHCAFAMANAV
jgi:hypothetical protein